MLLFFCLSCFYIHHLCRFSAGTRAKQFKQIALELEDKRRKSGTVAGVYVGEPEEAMHRLAGLFPTARPRVLRVVVKVSGLSASAV